MKTGRLPSLGATLAGLAMGRGTGPALPPEANRLTPFRDFGPNPGALSAWLYLPPKLREKVPLVVVLHGCTQSAGGYDHGSGWSQLADRAGFALLFPEQQRANNPNLCFNWFNPGDVTRGSGEVESIRQMISAAAAAHDIDAAQVFITGLSAGGAMTASMLACYPEVFAAGAIIAGLPHGVAGNVPQAFERMRGEDLPGSSALQRSLQSASHHSGAWPRISIWQGSADRTVAPVNAEALVKQWRAAHGVTPTPDQRETIDGARRRIWLRDGEIRIESWEITGMAHGTPLAPDRDGLGHPMPFMLDAGVSSTAHIAQFFGLGVTRQPAIASDGPVDAEPDTVARAKPATPDGPPSGVGDYVTEVLDKALPGQHGLCGSIKDVVDRALRRAGLR